MPVPSLDVPVPQMVHRLVEVLRLIDTVVPQQVIDVPKIPSQDAIPQRAALRVPQMAEQLVDEPMPSFDDSERVEEEEEEEQPRVVPESYFRDAAGCEWCPVPGLEGVYWWMIGTSSVQWTPPLRWLTCLCSCSLRSCSPSWCSTSTVVDMPVVAVHVEVPLLQFFDSRRNSSCGAEARSGLQTARKLVDFPRVQLSSFFFLGSELITQVMTSISLSDCRCMTWRCGHTLAQGPHNNDSNDNTSHFSARVPLFASPLETALGSRNDEC